MKYTMEHTSQTGVVKDEERLAVQVIEELDHNPLISDVANFIREHTRMGFPEEHIRKMAIQSFGSNTYDVEDRGLTVEHMPDKYNRLEWC